MGIRVECDWCREPIKAGRAYMTIELQGKVRGNDVSGPARVYCAEGDGESCASRLIAILDGNPEGPVDMGMEWRLVPVDGAPGDTTTRGSGNFAPPPKPVAIDADMDAFLSTLSSSARQVLWRKLNRQGVSTLEQLDAMTDDELMALEGVAWPTRCKIRDFINARAAAREQAYASVGRDIGYLNISARTYNALIRAGIESLHDLQRAVKDRSLLSVKRIGPFAVNEIETAIDEMLRGVTA